MKSIFPLTFNVLILSCHLINGIHGWRGLSSGEFEGFSKNQLRFPRQTGSVRVARGAYNYDPISNSNSQTGDTKPSGDFNPKSFQVVQNNVGNYSSKSTIIKIDKARAHFVEVLILCAPIIKLCLLTSLGQICPLSCILDPFDVGRHTVNILDGLTHSLCYPLGSIFDYGISHWSESSEQITRVSHFLSLFGVSVKSFHEFVDNSIEALPMQLIKFGKNPLLDALKPVTSSLSATLSGSQAGFSGINSFYNPVCGDADLIDSVQKLAEQFTFHPFSADIALNGWFVVLNAANLEVQGKLDHVFEAMLSVFKAIVGVDCSLIQYAETGKVIDCKLVVGKRKKQDGKNSKKFEEKVTCGTLPDLPPVDLHKLLPNIFTKTINYDGEYDDNQIK